MGNKPQIGPSLLKKAYAMSLGVIALAIAPIDYVQADLVKYSYTNTSGKTIEASPGANYLNPTSGVSFMVSGGIDRKLKLTIVKKAAHSHCLPKRVRRFSVQTM